MHFEWSEIKSCTNPFLLTLLRKKKLTKFCFQSSPKTSKAINQWLGNWPFIMIIMTVNNRLRSLSLKTQRVFLTISEVCMHPERQTSRDKYTVHFIDAYRHTLHLRYFLRINDYTRLPWQQEKQTIKTERKNEIFTFNKNYTILEVWESCVCFDELGN